MSKAPTLADLETIQAARRVLAVLDQRVAEAAEGMEDGTVSPAEVLDLLRYHADVALVAHVPAGWSDIWEVAYLRHRLETTTPEDGLEVTCA